VVEACESGFTSTFWTDLGVVFKNEFCVLCNAPAKIDFWRNCHHTDRDAMWSSSETELIMFLGVKDTLLETDTITTPRLACATSENVSISLALAYFKTKHVVIK